MLVHDIDQLGAMLNQMAGMWGAYRRELMNGGFTGEEALALVRDAQKLLLRPPEPDHKPPPSSVD